MLSFQHTETDCTNPLSFDVAILHIFYTIIKSIGTLSPFVSGNPNLVSGKDPRVPGRRVAKLRPSALGHPPPMPLHSEPTSSSSTFFLRRGGGGQFLEDLLRAREVLFGGLLEAKSHHPVFSQRHSEGWKLFLAVLGWKPAMIIFSLWKTLEGLLRAMEAAPSLSDLQSTYGGRQQAQDAAPARGAPPGTNLP